MIRVLLLLIPLTANAGSIQLHTYSEHTGGSDYRERNYGIGYQGEITLGYYRNSQYEDSFYIGKTWDLGHGFSGSLVAVTGYSLPVTPLPSLHYRFIDNRVSPVLTYAPTLDGGVFLLSIDVRLQ